LEGIKTASLQRIDPSQKQSLSVYFDRLILQLKQFNPG
jgi:hypothetical protein